MNLLGLTCDELAKAFQRRYGRGMFHAAALYRSFYRQPHLDIDAFPEFSGAGGLAEKVKADITDPLPRIVNEETQGAVKKLVFRLADAVEVESVIIPMANHVSLCVSSQAGCRMGCRFCETGQMGLQRNLSAHEIVAQVYTAKVVMGLPVRNVVFMGMGEPLDNLEPLLQAIRVLEDQRGMNIAKRHMTVSTAGLVSGIEKLAAQNWPQLKLAVSLNAPNDELRSRLMPVNRHYPLAQLKSALRKFPLARGNVLFMEYVLIKEQNDAPDHARQLADYLEGLPARVNLIPYNPRQQSSYEAPLPSDVQRFRQALIDQGIFVRLRKSKGENIQAACGQLGRRVNGYVSRFEDSKEWKHTQT